jgi:multidrug efflux pump subunit AcrA (membrane-fusion protein)
MLIIVVLYIGIAWLVFFRFKLLPFNWPWRIVTLLLGCAILAIFVALLNTLTPSGRIAVIGRVVEVTPNVAGTVTSIPVETNVLVKAGTVLFQIDPAPYDAKVKQLRAAVAEARQKVEQLKAQVDLAVADVKGLASQLDYAEKRRDDVEKLARTGATNQFALQDAVAKTDLLTAQLQAANAREINARLALGSEISGPAQRPARKRPMGTRPNHNPRSRRWLRQRHDAVSRSAGGSVAGRTVVHPRRPDFDRRCVRPKRLQEYQARHSGEDSVRKPAGRGV